MEMTWILAHITEWTAKPEFPCEPCTVEYIPLSKKMSNSPELCCSHWMSIKRLMMWKECNMEKMPLNKSLILRVHVTVAMHS